MKKICLNVVAVPISWNNITVAVLVLNVQIYQRPLNNVVRNLDIQDNDRNSYIVPRDGDGNNIEEEFFHPS